MTDGTGTTTYQYDGLDRLRQKVTPFGTLTYAYDAAGRMTSVVSSNAGGVNQQYSYDASGRLLTATESGAASTYTYGENGEVLGLAYPNGLTQVHSHDGAARVARVEWTMTSPRVFDYLRQPDGKTSLATESSGRVLNYQYDGGGRLSNARDAEFVYWKAKNTIEAFDALPEVEVAENALQVQAIP
jgi:YD repeat-containing protein